MLRTPVLAGRAEDEPPQDPALTVLRLFLHTFSDFLDRFNNVTLFELSEGPVHVSVVALSVELLGLAADIQRLRIDHMDVEQER